eukprot:UN27213
MAKRKKLQEKKDTKRQKLTRHTTVDTIPSDDNDIFNEPLLYHEDVRENRKLRFYTVWNNGEEENFRKLIEMKTIFMLCLPKMGGEYIVRHVMDNKHRLICCQMYIDDAWITIGGICVRPFWYQRFAEVVFLAVENHYQNNRVGRSIMRVMKEP